MESLESLRNQENTSSRNSFLLKYPKFGINIPDGGIYAGSDYTITTSVYEFEPNILEKIQRRPHYFCLIYDSNVGDYRMLQLEKKPKKWVDEFTGELQKALIYHYKDEYKYELQIKYLEGVYTALSYYIQAIYQ